MLERREQVSQVWQRILRPRLVQHGEAVRPLAALDGGPPFAVPAVEHQDRAAGGQPKHVAEVIGLCTVERNARIGTERGIDKQPGAAKIRQWHCKNPFGYRLLAQ